MTAKQAVFRGVVFVGLVAAGLAVDLATKSWIFDRLGMPGEQPVWWIIPGLFGFQTTLNEGALFGMGQGLTAWYAALSVVFVLGIAAWWWFGGGVRSWWLTVCLALITAGILGNLYDRLGLHGLRWQEGHPFHDVGQPVYAVRDWILVMIGSWPWPNFNIADSLLVCGVIALIFHTLFLGEPTRPAEVGPQRQPLSHQETARPF